MKIELVTFFSVVLNLIFLAVGLSVFACAVWILFDNGTLLTNEPSVELRTVGMGLMVIGGVVVVVSVIGCIGAVKKIKMLLLVYLGFLIVLILAQIFVLLLLLLNRNKIENQVDEVLVYLIGNYTGSTLSQDTLIDKIQHYEECCGSSGPSTWEENSYVKNQTDPDLLPCSCFNLTLLQEDMKWCNQTNMNYSVFEEGCTGKVNNWMQENIVTIVAMDIGLMMIQLVLFGLMVCLYNAVGRKGALIKPHLAPADHEALDPVPEDELPSGEQNYGYKDADEDYIDQAYPSHFHDYQGPIDRSTPRF